MILERNMKKIIITLFITIISLSPVFSQRIDYDSEDDEFGYTTLKPAAVVVTSTLKEKSKADDFYGANNLYDGTWKSWGEGEKGDGINSKITYKYNSKNNLNFVMIRNGYGELKHYYKNNRVKDIKITSGKQEVLYTLRDTYLPQYIELNFSDCDEITFEIISVYKGTAYEDTCISEIRLMNYPTDQTFIFEPDDYTKKAMDLIPNFAQFKCYYGEYKYKLVNRFTENDIVLAYINNGKLLLLLEEKQNDKNIVFYKEFDGTKWIDSNDKAFDYFKSLELKNITTHPIDEYPFKTDFYTQGKSGIKCFILTPDGFEEVFDYESGM